MTVEELKQLINWVMTADTPEEARQRMGEVGLGPACILCGKPAMAVGVFVPSNSKALGQFDEKKTRVAAYCLCKDHPLNEQTSIKVEKVIGASIS